MKKILFFILLFAITTNANATVSVTTNRVQYNCNGTTTSYAYPFKVFEDDDLTVIKSTGSVETSLVLNTDYTVTGAGTAGGNVVLTTGSECASGYALTITRDVELTQETDYEDGGGLSAETLETNVDRLTLIAQDQEEKIARAIKLPSYATLTDIDFPFPIANTLVGWNSAGTGLTTYDTTTVELPQIDYIGNYASLAAAVAEIGSNPKTLQINSVTTIADGVTVTVPSTLQLWFTDGGRVVGTAGGGTETLTINGVVIADPEQQIFGSNLTVTSGKLGIVYPEWWGAVADGTTDCVTAINAAITALGEGGELRFHKGTYMASSAINIPAVSGAVTSIKITGTGSGSIIKPSTTMTNLVYATGKNLEIAGITLINDTSYATNGIKFNNSSSDASLSANIHDCSIGGFTTGISANGQNYNIHSNFMQNNTTHIKFTDDGRNTSINKNIMLGGAIGIKLSKTATQAEGTRITDNTILVTGGSGSGIEINAGFELYIGHNIIDQTGSGSPGVYVYVTGTDAVNRIKMVGNWLAGGLNSYSFYASGNNSDLDFTNNTFACNNGQAVAAGLSLTDTQRANIIGNNFLLTGGGTDISEVSTSNIVKIANRATAGTAIANIIGATTVTDDLTMSGSKIISANGGIFASAETTPSVAGGDFFTSNATAVTITAFYNGVAGQEIDIISGGVTTFDTATNTRLRGSSVNIVTAAGDLTTWKCITGGTTASVWVLKAFVDVSANNSGGA